MLSNELKLGPLAGIKVIELGTHVAVPNVTRAMADCGAEVIKIEGLGGEDWRRMGRSYGIPYDESENAIFTSQNANKKFISLDLKKPEGHQALLKLMAEADVFISNVRIKGLQKMKLDYDSIKEQFPGLVYCHFTGFGYEGADADRAGFDVAAYWARSGAMVDWNNAGDFPIKPIAGFGDATTANLLLSGVMMALFARTKTGKGTFVSSSLFASALWYSAFGIIMAQDCYGQKYPKSRFEPAIPVAHTYECSDGEWINIAIIDYDKAKEKLLKMLDMEDMANQSPFDTAENLRKNNKDAVRILMEKFKSKTSIEWCQLLEEYDFVHEKLRHYSEVSKDQQAWDNHYLQEVPFPSGTKVTMPAFPLSFSDYGLKTIAPTPGIGADTDEVLRQIGYNEEDLKKMKEANAIN